MSLEQKIRQNPQQNNLILMTSQIGKGPKSIIKV